MLSLPLMIALPVSQIAVCMAKNRNDHFETSEIAEHHLSWFCGVPRKSVSPAPFKASSSEVHSTWPWLTCERCLSIYADTISFNKLCSSFTEHKEICTSW